MHDALFEPLGTDDVARLGDRTLLPDLDARAYLAHAGISPPSAPVRRAVDAVLAGYARHGARAFGRFAALRDELRRSLAALIGARAEDIAFVPHTSAGVIAIAQCFPWRPGDRVVVFDGDFPANVTPWQRAAACFDLELVTLPFADLGAPGGADWTRIDQALAEGVRLVAVSAVQFQTGLRVPLAELSARCHEHGAELFVDGIQGCGAVPLDVQALDIDYLAAGAHKWLMGIEGAGFLYISPARIARLVPRLAGWLSHEDPLAFLLGAPGRLRYDRPIRQRADFLEVGTPPVAPLAALRTSLALLRQLGTGAIFAHLGAYLDRLEAPLVSRGFTSMRCPDLARRSGILGLRPPAGLAAGDLVQGLADRGVVCSAPDGLVRFAPHWPNALAETDAVITAIDEVCDTLRS